MLALGSSLSKICKELSLCSSFATRRRTASKPLVYQLVYGVQSEARPRGSVWKYHFYAAVLGH